MTTIKIITIITFLISSVFSNAQDSAESNNSYQTFFSTEEEGFGGAHGAENTSTALTASLAMSQTVCEDAADLLWVSGFDGKIIHWELSEDEGTTWKIVNNLTSFYYYENLEHATTYRVLLKQDGQSYYSNEATISIDEQIDPGILVKSEGNGIRIENFEGNIQSWQVYEAGSWVTMENSRGVITLNTPETNRDYRVLVENGTCPTQPSPSFHFE